MRTSKKHSCTKSSCRFLDPLPARNYTISMLLNLGKKTPYKSIWEMTPSGKPRLSTTLPTFLNIIDTTQHKRDSISAKDKKAEAYINRKVWQKCPGKVLWVLTTSVEISLEMLSLRKNQCHFNCPTRKTKLFDLKRRQLPRKKTKSSRSLPDRLFMLWKDA